MSFDMTTLGDYISIQGGYAYKSQQFTDISAYPVLKIKNIRTGYVDFDDCAYIEKDIAEETVRYIVSEGDILISLTGSGPNAPQSMVGRVARFWDKEKKAWINQRVGRVVLKREKNIHKDFIFYFLATKESQNYLVANSSGSANQANINGKIIEAIPFPRFDYLTSEKIAYILRTLDEKILINNKINQTLESIAQTIFKSWFIDFEPVRAKIAAKLEEQDPEVAAMRAISGKSEAELEQMDKADFVELKATAALFPDELVESELGEVPRGWEIFDIDKATSLIIDHRGKTPKKLGAEWVDSGITALSAKHIKDGCIVNREQLRFVDVKLYAKWMKEELEEGDILLTSEGPMGEMYYLAFDEKYCLSQRLYALRANTNLVTSAFLYFWLLSPIAKSEMYGRATGTTVVGIRQSELRKVRVLTPSKPICELFDQKVKANLKQVALNNNSSLDLAQIRDILLPKLLSGEIDMSELQIEDDVA